jgi:hypothetical protein
MKNNTEILLLLCFLSSCAMFKSKVDYTGYVAEHTPILSVTYANHNIADTDYVFVGLYENGLIRLRKGKKVQYFEDKAFVEQIAALIKDVPERLQSEYPLTIRSAEYRGRGASGETYIEFIHPTSVRKMWIRKEAKILLTHVYRVEDKRLPSALKAICVLIDDYRASISFLPFA